MLCQPFQSREIILSKWLIICRLRDCLSWTSGGFWRETGGLATLPWWRWGQPTWAPSLSHLTSRMVKIVKMVKMEINDETRCLLEAGPVQYKKPAVRLQPGQEVGNFNFGSSIVLLFEAPAGLQFIPAPLEKLKLGQCLMWSEILSIF